MRAIVLGATGATGKALVEVLLADSRYTHVVTFVRRSSHMVHPKLSEHVIRFQQLQNHIDSMQADTLFNCMGTTLKAAGSQSAQRHVDVAIPLEFATLAQRRGVTCCVSVSSVNANANSKLFYLRLKGELETALRQLQFRQYIIFRPGMLDRPESNRHSERIAVKVVRLLNGIGLLKRQAPLPTSVLAKKLAEAPFLFPKGETVVASDKIAHL